MSKSAKSAIALSVAVAATATALSAYAAPGEQPAQPVLIENAGYDFPYYKPGESGSCGAGYCHPGEAHLTSDATGTYFKKWKFVGYARNAACKKLGAYSGIASKGEKRMSVLPSGKLHYVANHPPTRFEVKATVVKDGKYLEGRFQLNFKYQGNKCTTKRIKFKAGTNDEREQPALGSHGRDTASSSS